MWDATCVGFGRHRVCGVETLSRALGSKWPSNFSGHRQAMLLFDVVSCYFSREQRAGLHLAHRISIATQRGYAASLLVTYPTDNDVDEFF